MRPRWLLVLLLSGCAAANTPEACRIAQVAQIPIRQVGNFPLVEATINGKPALLLLDTGAESMVIGDDTFTRLELERDYTRPTYAIGLGAQSNTWPSKPTPVSLGSFALKPQSLLPTRLNWPLRSGNRVDGLLGSDVLGAYDVDIDMAHGRLTLYEPRRCPAGPPPFDGPSMTLAASGIGRVRLALPIKIDGVEIQAELDTGASRTFVDARAVGLSAEALERDRTVRTVTADPVGMDVRLHRFDSLQVGSDVVERPLLSVGKIERPGYAALLGSDYWRSRRVWISYAGRTVTVGPSRRDPR